MHISILLLRLFTSTAHAHVGYVVGQEAFAQHLGTDSTYFFSPLRESTNILLICATIIGIFVLYFLAYRITKIRTWIQTMRTTLDSYTEFIPWILRLSLGIALMGASAAQVLISPTLPEAGFAVVQLGIGFALLTGGLVVPAVLAGILLYVYALSHKLYLLGNLELLSALCSLLILGSARPGIDDLVGIPQLTLRRLVRYVPTILRIGIGGALTFLAIYEKVLNPHVSELVVQTFNLTQYIPVSASMWVFAVGMIELMVGLFLLIGFQTRLVSIIAFMVLVVTFFFFKEDVYSHVTLFGILSVLMITGGGPVSLDRVFGKRRLATQS